MLNNIINYEQRIAALQKQNKKLKEQLEKTAISPQAQANLYLLTLRGEISLLKFHLTGYLSNAAWKIVEKELKDKEMTALD